MENKKNLIILFFILLLIFILLPSQKIFAEGLSFFLDLKPLTMSIDAGGIGIGAGYEININFGFSLYGKIVYMNFYDVAIWLIYYLQGFKFYFNPKKYSDFFAGINYIVLYGSINDNRSINWGIEFDIGYKWLITGFERFYIEPQITYIYIFGELPLPGITFGLIFGVII
ncbi:MAG: hypothetical protein ACK4YF_05705 [Exilispira sp.]